MSGFQSITAKIRKHCDCRAERVPNGLPTADLFASVGGSPWASLEAVKGNLAFGSVITSLESFLWETVTYWVDHDEAALANIVTRIQAFRDQPLKLGQIFEKRENLRDDIKAYLQSLVWHQWNKVAPLFNCGLEIDIPSFRQFDNALIKRHDIVHRSGFTKTREQVNIDVAEIEALCEQMNKLVDLLQKLTRGCPCGLRVWPSELKRSER